MLQIVEFNNKYFKNKKLNEKKIFESKSVKEILKFIWLNNQFYGKNIFKKIDYYLPKIEKNINILKLVGKNKNDSLNIIEKIGIKQRHISNKNEFSNDLGIKAARKILQNFNKNKINCLIYCTNTPDYLLPSNSCLIHEKLNLKPSSGAFDIILACSGYVYALGLAKSLINQERLTIFYLLRQIPILNLFH